MEGITQRLLAVIEGGLTSDELINVIENVRKHMNDAVPESIEDAIAGAVHCELYETDEAISHLDSEQSLAEHLGYLDILAELTGDDAESAKEIVSQRISEIAEPDYEEHRPNFSRGGNASGEEFGDEELRSLFSNLSR